MRFVLPAVVLLALLVGYRFFWRGASDPLVVYCAHDSIYSESILRDFERRTGIPVAIRFDTEATKSLGLVELLLREKDNPRCDVFWNNELLGTMELQEKGVLQPYKGECWPRFRPEFKDPDGYWVGFAARLRVWIINTTKMPATQQDLEIALSSPDLSRVAIAKPLYGTTLTHYAALWHEWGEEKLKAWHRDLRKRGIREVDGNSAVKELVANGICYVGLTDTDDYFAAKDDGKPVDIVSVRSGERVICIPNTVAIVRGTKHLIQAQKLVDFLLSEEIEVALAKSKSRQIPLGIVTDPKLSDEMKLLLYDPQNIRPLTDLQTARKECLAWLKSEYAK